MRKKTLVLQLVLPRVVWLIIVINNPLYANGAILYKQACYTCHDSGLVNAPRLGDKSAWNSRATQGIRQLSQNVISGKGAMPPRGGTQYSDNQIKQVIQFMLSKVK